MRRRQRLDVLLRSFEKNIDRQRRDFVASSAATDLRTQTLGVAMSAMEVANTWSNFIRAYYLSCLITCRTRSGGTVTADNQFINSDPIGFAVYLFNPKAQPTAEGVWRRRAEPPWHDPYVLIQLASTVPLSNEDDIRAAFSIGSRVFTDLPVFRNYFAHRNQSSIAAALRLAPLNGIAGRPRPSEILMSVALNRTQSVFLDWLDDMSFTAHYLCD